MGLWLWCIQFYFLNYLFLKISYFWCNCRISAWSKKIVVFSGYTGRISSGYDFTIFTLRGSALVNSFDWDVIFIWFISWFFYWILSWDTSLPATLGDIAGGLAFLNISARLPNASLCPFNGLIIGTYGAGFCSA